MQDHLTSEHLRHYSGIVDANTTPSIHQPRLGNKQIVYSVKDYRPIVKKSNDTKRVYMGCKDRQDRKQNGKIGNGDDISALPINEDMNASEYGSNFIIPFQHCIDDIEMQRTPELGGKHCISFEKELIDERKLGTHLGILHEIVLSKVKSSERNSNEHPSPSLHDIIFTDNNHITSEERIVRSQAEITKELNNYSIVKSQVNLLDSSPFLINHKEKLKRAFKKSEPLRSRLSSNLQNRIQANQKPFINVRRDAVVAKRQSGSRDTPGYPK